MRYRSALVWSAVLAVVALMVWVAFRNGPERGPEPPGEPPRLLAFAGDPRTPGVQVTGAEVPWIGTRSDDPAELLVRVTGIREARGIRAGDDGPTSRGLEALATGRLDEAVTHFRRAVRERPEDAVARSDLAAALLARGGALARPGDAVEALDLLGAEPEEPASLFNRALALETLFLHRLAAAAWEEYLRRDRDSAWVEIARGRREALATSLRRTAPPPGPPAERSTSGTAEPEPAAPAEELYRWVSEVGLPAWTRAVAAEDESERRDAARALREVGRRLAGRTGDALAADEAGVLSTAPADRRPALAEGTRLFLDGRRALERYEFERARELFARGAPLLRGAGSPRALWADAGIAQCDYQLGHHGRARPMAERVVSSARRLGYLALQRRAVWVLTQLALDRLDLEQALAHATDLERLSREVGDPASIATARLLLARIYDELGAPDRAWSHRIEGLRQLAALGDQERLALTIGNASYALARQGFHGAATAFASEMVAFDRDQGTPLGLAESLWVRATHRARTGDAAGALDDVREAEGYLPGVASRDNRARLLAGLRAVEGSVLRTDRPALAARRLTEALAFLKERGSQYGRAELLLERARAWRSLGRLQDAAADLDAAFGAVESQRERIGQPLLRVSFFDLQAELADERVATSVALDDASRAFWASDRSKGLLFREGLGRTAGSATVAPALDSSAASGRLFAGDALVSYWSLPDELLIWIVRRDREAELVRRPVSRAILAEEIAELSRAIAADGSSEAWFRRAARLHRRLIAPIEDQLSGVDRLILVPDRVTRTVPWPALRANAAAPPLVARFVLRTSPTASTLFGADTRPQAPPVSRTSLLLALGDPRLTGSSIPVPPLPGARTEVQEVSRLFARPEVLLGPDATRERFLAALEGATVVHLASHFLVGRDLWSTTVVLSDAGGDERPHLRAREIAGLELPRLQLAVLSGCETQWEGRPSLEGTFSIAGAFLAAGATEVVATAWPVEDRASARLMKELYRQLLAGREADEALRAAQLTLLAEDGGDNSAAAWAAFRVLSLRPPAGPVQP